MIWAYFCRGFRPFLVHQSVFYVFGFWWLLSANLAKIAFFKEVQFFAESSFFLEELSKIVFFLKTTKHKIYTY